MKQSDDDRFIPMTSIHAGTGKEICPDIYYYTNQIVNVVFVGDPEKGSWILIDAGMPHSGEKILSVAEKRFKYNPRPEAIILTHGHFDHVGGIVELIEKWKVPVYAHPLEFPYLNGTQNYPEPDTSVQGGLLAKISSIYPNEAIDITPALIHLPEDHSIPALDGWRWIHTPGHSPGHISLFRDSDKTLIAGDAFITLRADSFYSVLTQKKEVNGPPRYLTTDWPSAKSSVATLDSLKPKRVITGHGEAMQGAELRKGLSRLVADFDKIALPEYGKFVDD